MTQLVVGNIPPQRNILLDICLQIFGVIFILFVVLWALFKITRLQINKNSFFLTYELLGIKWRCFSKTLSKQISKLELTTHPGLTDTTVKHMLFVKTKSQNFCLSRYANFTPEELEWLAEEISDYLDMPISRV